MSSVRGARWHHQEAVADVRLRLAESQHQARIAQERNAAAVQAHESLQRELAQLMASEQAGSRVVDELARAVEAARVELEAADSALQTARDGERIAREAQAVVEAERAAEQQLRQELQRERIAVDAELRQLEGRLQFLGEQQQQVRTQLEAWSLRQSTLTDELERRRGNVETTDRELREVDAMASIIEAGVGEADDGLELARKAVVEHEARLKAVEAELIALRTLLDHAQRRGPVRRGDNWERLLELIDVDPIHRAAVEAALEGWLRSWGARDREGFENAATTLAGAEDARDTLLYTEEPVLSMALPDGFTPILDLVTAANHVAPLVARLLRGAVLVADRAAAMRAVGEYPELRAVTPAGEIISAVSYRGGKAADALLEVQARIRDVESALEREGQAAL